MSSPGEEEEEEDKEEVEEEKSFLSSSSAPIDLTREEEEKEEEEEEPQPLAWRLLKRAAEKRCEEKQSQREEEQQQTLEAEPTPLEESSFLRNDFDDEEEDDDDDAQRERGGGLGGGGLGAPLSSPPDYSTKTDQELAKELAKFGMKRLGSRTAMIDCLMNIWTEKMVERGDGAAYSQRLEEELLSLSQRDQNACNNNNATNAVGVGMATKKRKNATTSTLRGGGERTPRTDEEEEEKEKQEDETDERALDAKLTAFLRSSRDVYASILRMEPLDLDEVKTLCQNGLRMKCISKVKLAKYFESKGVAVRHKSNHAAKLRKRKKKNTLSSTISPIREELH